MSAWYSEAGPQAGTTIRLTPREHEVMTHIALGKSSNEIADELFVSRRTIDFHLRQVYEKLGVKNRMAAYLQAVRLGLLATENIRRS